MSETLMEQVNDKGRDRGRWWILGAIVTVMLMGSVALVLWYDDPPADDGWMMPQIVKIPEEQNGLARFCRETDGQELVGNVPEMRVVDESNVAEVRAFLDANGEGQAKLDKLLATDVTLWRWPVNWENLTVSEPLPGVVNGLRFAQLLRLEGELLIYEKSFDEALIVVSKLRKLGEGWQAAEATMIHWLIGITVEIFGLQVLEDMAKAPGVEREVLVKIQQELRPDWGEISRALARSMRIEYLFGKEAEDPDGMVLQMVDEGWERLAVKWLVKENRCRNLGLKWNRPLLRALEGGSENDFVVACAWREEQYRQLRAEPWKVAINSNLGGYLLISESFPIFSGLYQRTLQLLVRERLMQIMLEMRMYELDQGKLPASLDDLVAWSESRAGGLKVIPMDPYSGTPLRWNPKEKVLYSVWQDGIDDAGAIGGAPAYMDRDIGLPYWWQKEPASEKNEVK